MRRIAPPGLLIAGTVLAIVLAACKKDYSPLAEKENDSVVFPTTQTDKQQVAVNKEVADIVKTVYSNPEAYYEASAAIYSGYYADERVLLKDLLFPEISLLYKSKKFKAFKSSVGTFKKEFLDALNKGNYPNLTEALGISSSETYRTTATGPTDTAREIFSNSRGVSIYFPYSENFGTSFSTSYFDNVNTNPNGKLATIVSADRDADSGPGSEPYKVIVRYSPNKPDYYWDISWRDVIVDDAYAELHPTHIIGVGAEPTKIMPANPAPAVNVVFIGDVKFTQQYDRLISFTGNGGGPELRFIRGSGFLQQAANGQITNATNTVRCDFKRGDKGKWKAVNSIWDSNWEPANAQQVFGIYEDDTQGSKTFSGSVQTTLTYTGGSTQIGPIGFSITVQTQDDIIRQLEWNRTSFFQYNQGGLNNGCGTRNGFTEYDCNSGVMYTMPNQ